MVYFMSLPLLAIQIDNFTSNILRGACYRTTSVSLIKNLLFRILKCTRSINAVHAVFYSISALYLATGPGKCVQLSINTP